MLHNSLLLFRSSCSSCLVLAVLSWLSSPESPVWAVLSWLSFHSYPFLAVQSTILTWLSCPGLLARLSCPGLFAWLSCPWHYCPSCPFSAVLPSLLCFLQNFLRILLPSQKKTLRVGHRKINKTFWFKFSVAESERR
jgi:hypothetical protein